LIANLVLLTMDNIGIPFESPFGGGIFLVHPKIGIPVTLVTALAGMTVASTASILPAHKAARLEPVVAFRGQST
jgi:ABC-type lipoprotein release transport system permease subunit